MKVLVADDNRGMLEALRARLQAEGFDVVTATDAYQAVASARREHPDLMLLDVNMPAGDGFSVQERFAAAEDWPPTPVIFMTGSDDDALDAAARAAGGSALLRKPFAASELAATIWGAIESAGDRSRA